MRPEAKPPMHLVIWLALVCVFIYLMIVVGGVTRLTQSGLSMVDWRPVMGIVPPLSTEAWQETFAAYKQYPEYQKINRGMSLAEFRQIFYWEYGHRVLGRMIGLIYFVPFVLFLMLGRVDRRWRPRLWMAFILGGLQGLMGWYMVQSGLVDMPRVSHYRLAAHLLLAVLILAFLFWLILDMLAVRRLNLPAGLRGAGTGLLVMLVLQLLLGVFTAGLDAGYGFNTWPLMQGQFIADAALMMQPFWRNFFENGVMIQFAHRWLGALLFAGILLYAFYARRSGLFKGTLLLLVVTSVQFVLGVATLIYRVPVALGSLHQAVACLMLLVMIYLVYLSRPGRVVAS